jgi:tetratricopeptide (TPR) repeat protein
LMGIAVVVLVLALPLLVSAGPSKGAQEKVMQQADSLLKDGKIEEAAALYKKLLEADARYAPASDKLAFVYMSLGKTAEAGQYARQAIALDPSLSISYNILGMIEEHKGNIAGAQNYYEKAVANNPRYAKAFNNLANIYVKNRDYPKAEETYKKAITLEPDLAMAHNNLAYLFEIEGNMKEARSHYQKALSINPGLEMAKNNLKRLDDKLAGGVATAEDRAIADSLCTYELPPGYRLVKGVHPREGGSLAFFDYNFLQKIIVRELPRDNPINETLFSQMIVEYKSELLTLLEGLMEVKNMKTVGQGYLEIDRRKVLYISTEFEYGGAAVEGMFTLVSPSKSKRNVLIASIADKGLFRREVAERFLRKMSFEK